MINELRITLNYPATLELQYGGEPVRVPMPLHTEHQFLLGFLPKLDETTPQERERFMLHLGQQLFETLFPAGALEVYLRAMAEQRRMPGASLRIRIVSSSPNMLTQPWEFMYDTRQGVFPATVPETPIVRTPLPVLPGNALAPLGAEPLRLLLVGASPEEMLTVDYAPELEAIAHVAEEHNVQVRILTKATYRAVREAVAQHRPHLVHMVCHGDVKEGVAILWLEGRLGTAHRVDARLLLEALETPYPRLVVLNACDTAKLNQHDVSANYPLQLLNAGIPAVVAMQHRIPDASGKIFSPALYRALLLGKPLENALQDARHALLVSGGLNERHFTTPTLWLATQQGGQLVAGAHEETHSAVSGSQRKPFLYLNSFGKQDAALFFGRSKAIEALISQVATHRLLVLHGRSGVGKTSLLQAGLVQSSAARFYLPVTLRFITHPMQALEQALEQALPKRSDWPDVQGPMSSRPPKLEPGADAPKEPTIESLRQQLKRLQEASGKTILLVMDQFEEFFILLNAEEKRHFIRALHAFYLDAGLQLRVILLIRQEYFGELDKLRDLFPSILASSFALSPLTQEGAREALVGPLDSLGIPYEPPLIELLIQDLWQDGVDPASLQIVGHHVYMHCYEGAARPLSVEAYRSLGGAGGILTRYLETFLSPFPEETQSQLLRVLSHFVTDQGTRQPASAAQIQEAESIPANTAALRLHELAEAHLIRRLSTGPSAGAEEDPLAARWELAHEVLISAIQSSDLSAVKRQVRRLRRKIRLQVLLLNLALAAVLALLYAIHDRSLWVTLHVDGAEGTQLTVERFPAQASCIAQAQEATLVNSNASQRPSLAPSAQNQPLETRVMQGNHLTWFLQEEGNYELHIRGADIDLRVPLRFEALSREYLSLVVSRPKLPSILKDLELTYIPAGEARIGDDPLNQHSSGLAKAVSVPAFYISRREITRGQFRAYVEAMQKQNPDFQTRLPTDTCYTTNSILTVTDWRQPAAVPGLSAEALERLPVVNVTFAEAEGYTRWLSSLSAHRFRLPTMIEWEKAARGVDQRYYPWGSCFRFGARANLQAQGTFQDPFERQAPVGSFGQEGASPYGVEDMSGNVHELTQDCFQRAGDADTFVPSGPGPLCTAHAFRGGSWRSTRYDGMTTSIGHIEGASCGETLGFRVVMEAEH